MRTLALAVVASLLPAFALAQTGIRRIFVEATNASGGAVRDLRPDEFEVIEGGERREIASAKLGKRPARIVLIVDATDGIRQPIGQVRKALTTLLDGIDPQHEMMLVTVAGTPQVRVRPTTERQQLVKSVENIFGTTGANVMLEVVQRLAVVINEAHESAAMTYQIEFASAPVKRKKPAAPDVRVLREGVRLTVIPTP